MNINQLLRSFISDAQPADAKTLELKVGQIVKGLVLQLLSDQDALLNIGGVQVKAHLETPLQQGQVTLLQVMPESKNGQVVLKSLSDSEIQISNAAFTDILKTLGLKDNPANRQLVQELHQESVPLTKENVQSLVKVMDVKPANVQEEQWRQAALLAVKRGIPVTGESVGALHQVLFGKPLMPTGEQLLQQISGQLLSKDNGLPKQTLLALQQTKLVLENLLELTASGYTDLPADEFNGPSKAQSKSASTVQPQEKIQQTMEAVKTNSNTSASIPPKAAMDATVTNGQPLANTAEDEVNMVSRTSSASAQQTQSQVSGQTPASAQSQASTQSQTPSQVNAAVNKTSDQPDAQLNREKSTQESLTNPQQSLVPAKPEETSPWISKMLKSLGVEHEQMLFKSLEKAGTDLHHNVLTHDLTEAKGLQASADSEKIRVTDTLKSALLQLSAADGVPDQIRETGHQLLQQITGQQLLLSPDRNSMFSHITLMIPMLNADGKQTAAVHIQSRKGSRGEIDTNNCRLLFDLHMKALGDTLVDVQVFNRIVSLQVHNDQPFIADLLDGSRDEISAGLQKIGYQFLSLKCSPFPKDTQHKVLSQEDGSGSLKSLYSSKPYKGVDIRV